MLDLENISKEIRDLENVCKKFITHVTYHPPHSYSNNTTTPNDFFSFFFSQIIVLLKISKYVKDNLNEKIDYKSIRLIYWKYTKGPQLI